ncbi:hypothetical protein A2U01_0069541, partial [Trifolium medium]|nr:hypothetical protein [Trifolium medium]
MYEESVRGFKEVYYGIRPTTMVGWNNIVRRGYRVDENNNVVHGPDGQPIEDDFARFPFYWTKEHYLMNPNEFVFGRERLSQEEFADYQKLLAYVKTFPANVWE